MKARKIIPILLLALMLVAASGLNTATAYFTSHTASSGGQELSIDMPPSEPDEDVDPIEMTKRLTVTNDSKFPVFVRARAYAPDDITLVISGSGWSLGSDGWYYYDSPIDPQAKTAELLVKIENVPADAEDGDNFNVVLVYEVTRVRYNDDGSEYADWDSELIRGEETR
jgi:hypothetical protein